MGCLWSWCGDQLPRQSSRPSGRGDHGLQKAWEKDTCAVLLLRALTLISGIKACLWRDPCRFCECRVETGDFVLHKVKAQGSMIQSGFFFFQLGFKWNLFHVVEKEIHLTSLSCQNVGEHSSDSSDAFFFCLYLFYYICLFNWRIIALQYWGGFCHTSTWISHRYTYVPSILNLPPISHPTSPL